MPKHWEFKPKNSEIAERLAQEAKITKHLAQLLLNRGIETAEEAKLFLDRDWNDISSPYALLNMGAAVEQILACIEEKGKIVVFGDYDVDGITSSVLLTEALHSIGAEATIYIPSRLNEGYGLNAEALNKLQDDGVTLVITVDNGISAKEVIDPFIQKGLSFVVTDHHEIPSQLPNCPVVNPHLDPDPKAPYRNLCGAGVALMLAWALLEKANGSKPSLSVLAPYVELAALATVADIVPLRGDNRLIVSVGLEIMQQFSRAGIEALSEQAGVQLDALSADDISFQLAPRINAAGRLDQAEIAIALLRSSSLDEAQKWAIKLNELNQKRKDLESEAFDEALSMIETETPIAVVVYGEKWHPGVIGIVASRLVEKFGVPAIVLTQKNGEAESVVGSGRAPMYFDLYQALEICRDPLLLFGGHEKAAGLSINEKKINEFRQLFENYCVKTEKTWYGKETYHIDAVLSLNEVNENLWAQHNEIEPTGCGNPKPLLALESVPRLAMRQVGREKDHLQIEIPWQERILRGIAFRQGGYEKWKGTKRHDLIFHLNKRVFRGQSQLELIVADLRPAFLSGHGFQDDLYLNAERYLVDDAYVGIENCSSFRTKIVGVSFEDRQRLLAELSEEERLHLQREPENPYDTEATAVYCGLNKIGYLNRKLAAHIAPLIDKGVCYEVELLRRTGGDDKQYGVNIQLRKVREAQVKEPPAVQITLTDAEDIAQHWLDGSSLHAVQRRVLEGLKNGENILTVMGTGRGKSLIYQAMAVEKAITKQEMTVVFFPLRALLNDQFMSLQERLAELGLTVWRAFGESSLIERENFSKAIKQGHVDLILTTPEYYLLHAPVFLAGPRKIGFFVVDEAHHLADRRKGYQELKKHLRLSSEKQILALTATVPTDGHESIIKALNIDAVYCDDYLRSNLNVIDSRDVEQKIKYLLNLFKHREKTIVYVNSRKQAWSIAATLRSVLPHKWRKEVAYYHSGLGKKVREQVASDFSTGQIRFLIATTAFGEGLNIRDIRHVVLYHLCFSRESFNQLAGRAGRDGAESHIHLLYGERDQSLNELLLATSCPSKTDLAKIFKGLRVYLPLNEMKLINYADFAEMLRCRFRVTFEKETLSLAMRIFTELSFVIRYDTEQGVLFERVAKPKSKDLEDSMTYIEGLSELKNYESYTKLAFHRDLKYLFNAVQKPLRPPNVICKGGD